MADTPDALIRRWFEDVWNRGREDTIDELVADGAKIYGLSTPDGQPISGPDEFKPFYRQFRQAFPDIRITIVRTVTQGDVVAAHCDVTATHSSNGLVGVPASGRPVHFSGMCMVRIAEGRFVEGWNVFDFLTCYQQMGLLPQLHPSS